MNGIKGTDLDAIERILDRIEEELSPAEAKEEEYWAVKAEQEGWTSEAIARMRAGEPKLSESLAALTSEPMETAKMGMGMWPLPIGQAFGAAKAGIRALRGIPPARPPSRLTGAGKVYERYGAAKPGATFGRTETRPLHGPEWQSIGKPYIPSVEPVAKEVAPKLLPRSIGGPFAMRRSPLARPSTLTEWELYTPDFLKFLGHREPNPLVRGLLERP